MHIASLTSFQYTMTDLKEATFNIYSLDWVHCIVDMREAFLSQTPYKPFPPPSTDTGLLHAANTNHIIYM